MYMAPEVITNRQNHKSYNPGEAAGGRSGVERGDGSTGLQPSDGRGCLGPAGRRGIWCQHGPLGRPGPQVSRRCIRQSLPHPSLRAVEADVWACGIWLVALLVGAFPFDNRPGVDDRTAEMQIL